MWLGVVPNVELRLLVNDGLLEGFPNLAVPNAHEILAHHSVFDPDGELGKALDDFQFRVPRRVRIVPELLCDVLKAAVDLVLNLGKSAACQARRKQSRKGENLHFGELFSEL
jgi:hypothetical protein